jgi:hypothetical protein
MFRRGPGRRSGARGPGWRGLWARAEPLPVRTGHGGGTELGPGRRDGLSVLYQLHSATRPEEGLRERGSNSKLPPPQRNGCGVGHESHDHPPADAATTRVRMMAPCFRRPAEDMAVGAVERVGGGGGGGVALGIRQPTPLTPHCGDVISL